MNAMQQLVRDFHVKMGADTGGHEPREVGFRGEFVLSEAKELATALQANDLVETIDGICDLLYVALGTAVSLGVDIEPFFEEVHRSNMTKTPAGNGKATKGPDYSPPEIAAMLYGMQEHDHEWDRLLELTMWRLDHCHEVKYLAEPGGGSSPTAIPGRGKANHYHEGNQLKKPALRHVYHSTAETGGKRYCFDCQQEF